MPRRSAQLHGSDEAQLDLLSGSFRRVSNVFRPQCGQAEIVCPLVTWVVQCQRAHRVLPRFFGLWPALSIPEDTTSALKVPRRPNRAAISESIFADGCAQRSDQRQRVRVQQQVSS